MFASTKIVYYCVAALYTTQRCIAWSFDVFGCRSICLRKTS